MPNAGKRWKVHSLGVFAALVTGIGIVMLDFGRAMDLVGHDQLVALKRKAGTLLIQGEMTDFPNFPIGKVTVKYITIKSARGHSYKSCELALQQLATHRFPLEMVTTHTFSLADADTAIKAVGGAYSPDVIHVSLLPWQ